MKASRLLIAGAVAALLPLAGAYAQSTPPPAEEPSSQPATAPDTPSPTTQPQQGATFESLDKNGDGKISKSEAAADANVSQQFSRYDKNGNGYIERDEVNATNNPPPADPSK